MDLDKIFIGKRVVWKVYGISVSPRMQAFFSNFSGQASYATDKKASRQEEVRVCFQSNGTIRKPRLKRSCGAGKCDIDPPLVETATPTGSA
jgi:hypothetical protein